MTRKLLFSMLLLGSLAASAQQPSDAIRYSWTVSNGTARQQAIGGAMGSLGGDITAANVNPAGLGFYKTHDGLLTMAYHAGKNKSSYLGRKEKEKDGKFDFGASGFVFASGSDGKEKSHAFSISFNTTGNFRNDLLYRGRNNQSSHSQRFLEELSVSGVKDSSAAFKFPFGASLALNTYLLDPVKNSSGQITGFSTNAPIATGLLQEYKSVSRGGIYETALGLASNHNDKFFIGGSLGFPYLHHERTTSFTEADATTDTSNRFDFSQFSENIRTTGLGVNFKLGIIYKPAEFWRLGLALHTPTVYQLSDLSTAELTTDTEGYAGMYTDYSVDYPEFSSETKYLHVTPYRLIGSISYVLREIQDVTKQRGFLTADVEYLNYKASSYHVYDDEDDDIAPDPTLKPYYKSLNKAINNAYKGAFNFRVGGELKFTTLMVRAGAAYYGNPYKTVMGGKGEKFQLSGGLGYRHRGYFIDLTYVHAMNRDIEAAYRLQNNAYPVAQIRSTVGNIVLTGGIKF